MRDAEKVRVGYAAGQDPTTPVVADRLTRTNPTGGMPVPAAQRRGLALAALCMAAFVISLDTTIVNVALPSLVRQLHASTTDLQWVVDAYSLVFTTLILAAGSLSDRLGRKGTLTASVDRMRVIEYPCRIF